MERVRAVHIYLLVYAALVLGALGALWSGGALQQIPVLWVVVALMVAAGFGVMLALSAGRRHATEAPPE